MSERPENPNDDQLTPQGGWQLPQEATPWQARAEETSSSTAWRTVKALPDDIDTEPEERGSWHRPQPEDTTFSPDDEIALGDDANGGTSDGGVTQAASLPTPEDLLAEITGQQRTVAPNPEDFVIPSGETVDSEALDAGETLLVDEEARTAAGEPVDEDMTIDAQALDDDESFTMSEYIALANLAQDDDDLTGVNLDDLSPAERALYNIASQTEQEMEMRSSTDAFDAVDEDDSQFVQTEDNQAADYARQQLQQLSGDGDGDTGFGQATQDMPAQQAQYTQEEIQLAQQFRETKRQVAVLRQMQAQGQIDQTELQTRLQEYTILDPQGNWWMVGYETDEWYRYNNMNGQWEVAQPPVPLDAGQARTETGLGEAAPDVLPGSLPYLPEEDSQGDYEYSSDQYSNYDNTQYNSAQEQYTQQYGVGDTPIPNPDQPAIDPNLTQVGQNFDATSQTYAEPTLQGINYVDQNTVQSGGFDGQATVPSQAQEYIDQSQYDEFGVPRAEPAATGFEDYSGGEAAPEYEQLVEEQRSNVLAFAGIAVFVVAILGLLSVGGFFFWATNEYNTIIAEWENEIAALGSADFDFQTATVLAADGTVIAELTGEEGARTIVSIEDGDVSPWFVHAIVSSEDATFYENAGFDQFAIVRAFWQNLVTGDVVSGASTITQQIVRERVLGSSEVTFDRKLTEVLVSLAVAERYSKNEILDIYINEFFYGEQSYGVEAASQFYFNTSAAELDAAQAATLAGILPSPSNTNPVVAPDAAFANMRLVLNRMIEVGCLDFQHGQWIEPGVEFCVTADTLVDDGSGGQTPLFRLNPNGTFGGFLAVQIAQVESRRYEPRQTDIDYPHFVFYVLGELDAAFGRGAYIERGFTVQTTLIPRIQNTAEGSLRQQVDDLGLNGVQTGAVLVTNPTTGAIVAMVGSPDFFNDDIDGQNNNTLSPQQPGSAIKPVVYADAFSGDNGVYYTPATTIWDVPSSYNLSGTIYTPENFDGQHRGPVPARFALAQSLNIPAVKTYLDFNGQPFTPQSFIDMGNRLGIEFDVDGAGEFQPAFGVATAIGATEVTLMDLTQAYSTIANDGVRLEPYAIDSITEGDDLPVAVPLTIAASEGNQAISAQVAYLLQNVLSDNNARTQTINGVPSTFPVNSPIAGSALGLQNQLQVAAKTGTNNTENGDPSRLWTVGFTNNYTVGVWIGTLNQGTPISGDLTGLTAASPIWNAVMQEALNGVNPGSFNRPSNIREDTVCQLTGTLSPDGSTCPIRYVEQYIETLPPPPESEGYVATLGIDSWTGLRANQFCPDNIIERTFADIDDSFAVSWLNSTGRGRNILNQLGLPSDLSAPPAESCQQGQALPTIRINFPSANVTVTENVGITGQVSTPNLQRWELQIAPINTENFSSIMPQARTDQVQTAGTVLFDWDSRQVQNGQYTLRLAAFSTVNGGFVFVDVPITVQNTPPTPTPAPTSEPPTAEPIISPIPFDLPTATPLGS